jgi:uncharacterized protein (DUF58 family)
VIEVTARVDHALPSSFSAGISDLLPDGAVAAGGSPAASLGGSPVTFGYAIAPLVIGRHTFPGIRLDFSDLFFSTTVTLLTAGGPDLTVFPASEFALPGKDAFGESEAPAFSPLPSPGVRSFRRYQTGDDPRKIDWKLSAKHDTLYVREHMGVAEDSRLLVVDLPDASLPYPADEFSRLKEAAVASAFPASRAVSVLLISGPNVIAFLPMVADPERLVAMMQGLAPAPRLHALYRYPSTMALRSRTRKGLAGLVTAAFLPHRTATSFEDQVARALSGLSVNTAHLFSLVRGDPSHLCLVAEQGRRHHVAFHLHVPRGTDQAQLRARIAGCPFATLEAV